MNERNKMRRSIHSKEEIEEEIKRKKKSILYLQDSMSPPLEK